MTFNFIAASLRPADSQSIVDSLRQVLLRYKVDGVAEGRLSDLVTLPSQAAPIRVEARAPV
jgi:hypothetical protein